jgi:neutral trehalase
VNCPRSEAFLEDYYLAVQSERDMSFYWESTNSAVESGMDFSTRWYTMIEESGDEDMACEGTFSL